MDELMADAMGPPKPPKEVEYLEDLAQTLKLQFSDEVEMPLLELPAEEVLMEVAPIDVLQGEYMRTVNKSVEFFLSQFSENVLGSQYVVFSAFMREVLSLNTFIKPDSILQKVMHLLGDWFASRGVKRKKKCDVAYRIYSVIYNGEVLPRKQKRVVVDFKLKSGIPKKILDCRANWKRMGGSDWWGVYGITPVKISVVEFAFSAVCGYYDVSRESDEYVGYYSGTYAINPRALVFLKKLGARAFISYYDDDPHVKRSKSTGKVLSQYGVIGKTRNKVLFVGSCSVKHLRVPHIVVEDDSFWDTAWFHIMSLIYLSHN